MVRCQSADMLAILIHHVYINVLQTLLRLHWINAVIKNNLKSGLGMLLGVLRSSAYISGQEETNNESGAADLQSSHPCQYPFDRNQVLRDI